MILTIMTVYNELEFMPLKKAWCDMNRVGLYVIDNYSDDGTWEWLQDNGIPSHRFDTGGAFHLDKLQEEIIRTTDKIKPNWVIYNGADLFPFVDWGMSFLLEKIEGTGCNMVELPMIDVCRTDETGPPFECEWYRHARDRIGFIYKWEPGVKYRADYVELKNRRPMTGPGIMMNMGRTKGPKARRTLLKRRQKAWKQGLDPTSGRHYLREKASGWVWDKKDLLPLKNSEYYKYVREFNKYLDKCGIVS